MIDLYSIKLNNKALFDNIASAMPVVNGKYLIKEDFTVSSVTLRRGHIYDINVSTSTITRVDELADEIIQSNIYSTIENVCEYLNNYFYVKRTCFGIDSCPSFYAYYPYYNRYFSEYGTYTFASGVLNDTSPFKTNDLVRITGSSRNNMVSYIELSGTNTKMLNENVVDDTSEALLLLMQLPQAVEKIISNMLCYDYYFRGNPNNLKSESIGNYSYTKDTVLIGSLDYPLSMVNSLNTFMLARIQN